VVTLTTADVTFKLACFTFAGRVAVLGASKTTGNAMLGKLLGWAGFPVHLGASILTILALYTFRFTIGP